MLTRIYTRVVKEHGQPTTMVGLVVVRWQESPPLPETAVNMTNTSIYSHGLSADGVSLRANMVMSGPRYSMLLTTGVCGIKTIYTLEKKIKRRLRTRCNDVKIIDRIVGAGIEGTLIRVLCRPRPRHFFLRIATVADDPFASLASKL
jgi:hypothetical protein